MSKDEDPQPEEREPLTRQETFDVNDAATQAKNIEGVALVVWRGGELRCYVYEHVRAIE
jgi:hypothetical protein